MRWEYRIYRTPSIYTTLEDALKEFNALGAEGWELVAQQGGGIFWFKRIVP